MQETDKIWMNGELVDWADAKVHVGAHGLHYGSGVFEGIRCYETEKGPAVFRLQDHLQRLEDSAKVLYMDLPYSTAELRTGDPRARRGERPADLLRPADRVLRLRRARGRDHRQSRRRRHRQLPLGGVSRGGRAEGGDLHDDLELGASRART